MCNLFLLLHVFYCTKWKDVLLLPVSSFYITMCCCHWAIVWRLHPNTFDVRENEKILPKNWINNWREDMTLLHNAFKHWFLSSVTFLVTVVTVLEYFYNDQLSNYCNLFKVFAFFNLFPNIYFLSSWELILY